MEAGPAHPFREKASGSLHASVTSVALNPTTRGNPCLSASALFIVPPVAVSVSVGSGVLLPQYQQLSLSPTWQYVPRCGHPSLLSQDISLVLIANPATTTHCDSTIITPPSIVASRLQLAS
jgi:hypothetical protein